MKAVVIREFGGPEVLHLERDFPMPAPEPGEVTLAVHAVSVNRTLDLAVRAGTYVAPISENLGYAGDFLSITFNPDSTFSVVLLPNAFTEGTLPNGTYAFTQQGASNFLTLQFASVDGNVPPLEYLYTFPASATFGGQTVPGIELAFVTTGFSETLDSNHFLALQGTLSPGAVDHALSNGQFGYGLVLTSASYAGDLNDLTLNDDGTWQGNGYPALQAIGGTWSTSQAGQTGSQSILTLLNQDGSPFDYYAYTLEPQPVGCTSMAALQLTAYETGASFTMETDSLLNP